MNTILDSEPDILPWDRPFETIPISLDDIQVQELMLLASQEHIPDQEYTRLLSAPECVQEVLASNPNLRDPFLSALIMVSNYEQAGSLASNPALTEQHVRMLFGRHPELLPALKAHPSAPEDLAETVFFEPGSVIPDPR